MPIPVPDSLNYFPFQIKGIRFALEREGTLLADEMGIGKTIQAIGVINADPTIQKVLIVCPAVMRLVWKRELERWLTRSFTIGIIGIDTNVKTCTIVICNYDRLHTLLLTVMEERRDLCIIDESHYCKNPLSRRTRIATSIRAKRRLALSGTPLLNHPMELTPILSWLDPVAWPRTKWFEFGQRYGGAIFNGFGWQYGRGAHLGELSERLRSTVMIRRTKKEVLPELPAKLRTIIEIQPDRDNIAKLVKSELEAFYRFEAAVTTGNDVHNDQIDDDYARNVRALKPAWTKEWENLAKARHQTALAKIPYVVNFITETLAAGAEKIVLWCHHRAVAFQFVEELKAYRPVLMLGGMSVTDRQKAIDDFQSLDETKVFVGGITAAGLGITLTRASHCIFAELSWVPAEMTQAEDRLHRIGAMDNILVQHLILAGSLDSVMARTLIRKQEILSQVFSKESVAF
jgi:SWI/SNF-related matrix-associated actin-dependent regulator 1 of chromatin subfamily A